MATIKALEHAAAQTRAMNHWVHSRDASIIIPRKMHMADATLVDFYKENSLFGSVAIDRSITDVNFFIITIYSRLER